MNEIATRKQETGNSPSREKKTYLNRRSFLRLMLGCGGAAAAVVAENKLGVLSRVFNFFAGRAGARELKVLRGKNIISREASDAIFRSLLSGEFDKEVLNEQTFFEMCSRISGLVSIYYPGIGSFEKYFTNFISEMIATARELEIGLPQVLISFITSARNIGNEGYNSDVAVEIMIKQVQQQIEGLPAEKRDAELINLWNMGSPLVNSAKDGEMKVLDIPRVMGPRTFGIHDMESLMIARSLLNNSESDMVRRVLQEHNLLETSQMVDAAYEGLESIRSRTRQVIDEIFEPARSSSNEIKQLLGIISDPAFIREILSDKSNANHLDAWQLTHTTQAWYLLVDSGAVELADVTEEQQNDIISQITETATLSADGHQQFLSSQISNPKLNNALLNRIDEASGKVAELLSLASKLNEHSEIYLSLSQQLDRKLIPLERDPHFQLIAGVSYISYLHKLSGEHSQISLTDDSVSLGTMVYSQLLFGGQREIGPLLVLTERLCPCWADLPYITAMEISEFIDTLGIDDSLSFKSTMLDDPAKALQILRNLAGSSKVRTESKGKISITDPHMFEKAWIDSPGLRTTIENLEAIYPALRRSVPD
ncbi:MAG: hypothetical protein COU66_04300 [Candidatus Pacebacteria bacterium CG10_big_fil_rev_8_21_14_0_10_44_11]|nr:MAG: hypothetical protein COU66_04300 [Candidatus Pacebacteria bacterium CG10_big_fil_rev_8_21_14_0_10_44_11]